MVRDDEQDAFWQVAAVMQRYQDFVVRFAVAQPYDLLPERFGPADRRDWLTTMRWVIAGIESGDLACAQIGVELLEQDRSFFYGAVLKSNTARALRRFAGLSQEQVGRIRRRIARLYATGTVPREFDQCLKLIHRLGPGSCWQMIRDAEPRNHLAHRAQRFFRTRFDRAGTPRPVAAAGGNPRAGCLRMWLDGSRAT